MIIDCHYHLEPRMLSMEKLIAKMDSCGIDRVALMATMADPLPHASEFIQKIIRFSLSHRSLRFISRMALTRFTADGSIKLPAGDFAIYADPDNDAVFQTVASDPDRFYGWVFVNPNGENDPLTEFEKWRGHPGCIGVKAHPMWHRYPIAALIPVAEQSAALGKPLLIHAGFGAHGDFKSLIDAVPDLKLILAHAGFPGFSDTWKAIREFENVFVDLSQSIYVDEKTMRGVVNYLGPDRCLYGTDGPYGEPDADGLFDFGFLKTRIERLFPEKETQRKILGENFLQLTGF